MPSLSTRARCKAALGARLPGLAEQEDLTDWLADEVLDAGAWASAESLQAAVGQYLLDWGVCTSELDTALACEDLHVSYHSPDTRVLRTAAALVDGSSLEAAVAGGSAAQPEEPLAPGLCQLCSREMPLTEHHLFPRETHKKLLKRGLMSPADRLQKILICRPCHNTVHRTLDNERLALDYHSLDSLLQHEAIQRWVKFAAKQKTRGLQHGLKVPR